MSTFPTDAWDLSSGCLGQLYSPKKDEMDDLPITTEVVAVRFNPGSASRAFQITTYSVTLPIATVRDDAGLTFDGEEVTFAGLMARLALAEAKVMVTLTPDPMSYGAAVKAEFRIKQ